MRIRLLGIVLGVALAALLTHALASVAGSGEERDPRESLLQESVAIDWEGRGDAQTPGTVSYETWFRGGTIVNFDHGLHVEGMELECSQCHHLEACDRCHLKQAAKALIRDSQVAIHDACFRCHEQEPGGTGCSDCHTGSEPADSGSVLGGPASGVDGSTGIGLETHERFLDSVEADLEDLELIGERMPRDHSASEPPGDHVFVTSHDGGSMVLFPHQAHAEADGITCASCHHLERCGLCHDAFQKKIVVKSAQTASMGRCVRCHGDLGLPTGCSQCHVRPRHR